jgi:hypothetical protein
VPWLHAALVGAQEPALGQRGDPVDAGKELVGRQSGAPDNEGLVAVVRPAGRRIGGPAVAEDDRAWFDVSQQERAQGGGAGIVR